MANTWLEPHKELVQSGFGIILNVDAIGDLNMIYKELGKNVVFMTRPKVYTPGSKCVQFHGFDDIEEAIGLLVSDMVENTYAGTQMHARYSIVDKTTEIIGTIFKGKPIILRPITSGVAVLIKDPSEDKPLNGIPSVSEFNVIAGTIPYINIEVQQNERQESESIEESDESSDEESGGQGELFDSEDGEGEI